MSVSHLAMQGALKRLAGRPCAAPYITPLCRKMATRCACGKKWEGLYCMTRLEEDCPALSGACREWCHCWLEEGWEQRCSSSIGRSEDSGTIAIMPSPWLHI
eukprot:1149337-Pelagomonas_calceolata.AAC.5